LAFGGTRTYHHLVCALEETGWEIRDCLMWLYGSGFPKSLDIAKSLDAVPATELARRWDGWGTALKPAWEPIILAMKPMDGTFARNAQKHAVAGLHIDGGRVEYETGGSLASNPSLRRSVKGGNGGRIIATESESREMVPHAKGRWPANLMLDEHTAEMLDGQSGTSVSRQGKSRASGRPGRGYGMTHTGSEYNDSGGASRFFYCAKANKRDRTCDGRVENNHPTVKPRSLMEYLCRLVTPPGGGLILDPFMGSGSTGIGALSTGNRFVGIELEPESFETARRRIETVSQRHEASHA
jgi:site-specific DNA-methyltransferase (adenine-specific)